MTAGVIALIVLAVFVFIVAASGVRIVPQARAGRRRAARPLRAHARPGADADRPVRRPRQAADRPARAGRRVPAAAGDHRGQPRGRHRHRHLLHGHRPEGRDLRDRQPAAGDRAAHGHHAAQRDRRPDARGDADQPRQHQLAAARRARRGDRQAGASASTASSSSRSSRRARSRRRWRSRCAPSATAARRSSPPRASSSRRSSPPRARSRRRCCKAEGARTAAILRAEGEAKAIETVFQAIHDGAPDQQLLTYQYLQMLPQLAQGEANKIFVIPSEFTQALGNIGSALGRFGGGDDGRRRRSPSRARAAARRDRREGPGRRRRRGRRRRAGDGRGRGRATYAARGEAARSPATGGRRRPTARSRRRRGRPQRCGTAAPTLNGVFDSLSEKLQETLAGVRGRGALTEEDINAAMREIRLALLEADVNFKVVKQFTSRGQGARARRRGPRSSSTPASRSSRSSTRS